MRLEARRLHKFLTAFRNGFVNTEKVRVIAGKRRYQIECVFEETASDDRYQKYELYDEVANAEEFSKTYWVGFPAIITSLNVAHLWFRYLQEKAEVIFTDGDGNRIHFRKFRDKTMIFSKDLSYYTEEYSRMSMPWDFKNFINQNWELTESLRSKRYQI